MAVTPSRCGQGPCDPDSQHGGTTGGEGAIHQERVCAGRLCSSGWQRGHLLPQEGGERAAPGRACLRFDHTHGRSVNKIMIIAKCVAVLSRKYGQTLVWVWFHAACIGL